MSSSLIGSSLAYKTMVAVINTLSYHDTELITSVKRFIVQALVLSDNSTNYK
jgi:hypothetical protein